MMKTLKRKQQILTWSLRALTALLLILVTVAVVLYQRGYYDFTFIERSTAELPQTGGAVTDRVPDTQNTQGSAPSEETDGDIPIPTEPETPTPSAAEVLAAMPSYTDAQNDGYTAQSGGEYGDGWVLARTDFTYEGTKYAYTKYDVRAVRVTEYNRTCFVTSEITERVKRPAILAKNGYLIIDNADKTYTLYDVDGNLLLENYEEKTYALTDLSTADGKAIFMKTDLELQMIRKPIYVTDQYTGRLKESGEYEEEESEVLVEVYTYFTLENGEFKPLDIYAVNEAKRVGVIYDAPTDYGKSDCNIEVYASESGERFGYRDKTTGKPIVYATYLWAHEFRDGYGICSNGRELLVFNEKGETVYRVGSHAPEIFFTANELTYPDTNGIEALGCYYFDHGLTRVRMRPNLVTYMTYYYIKTDDYTTLIDVNGNEFPIPGGYTLEGYSDGILLLKKENEELYGYMNYKGEWIVPPEYSYARPFIMGLGVIGDTDGKKGIVGTDGEFVVPMAFDEISDISKGTVTLYDKSVGWYVCRLMDK